MFTVIITTLIYFNSNYKSLAKIFLKLLAVYLEQQMRITVINNSLTKKADLLTFTSTES